MTILILSVIYMLVLKIAYDKVTTLFKYNPTEECAMRIHTGDMKMAMWKFIEVLIVYSLIAALLKYSLLTIIELAIIVVSAFE